MTLYFHSHEECLQNKRAEAENYRHIEEESNKIHAQRLLQKVGDVYAVVNPPYPYHDDKKNWMRSSICLILVYHTPKYKGEKSYWLMR